MTSIKTEATNGLVIKQINIRNSIHIVRTPHSPTAPMTLFLFNFFKVLSFLHLEITLPLTKLCYAFEEKLFFSVNIMLLKSVILSCLKMNLKITLKLR